MRIAVTGGLGLLGRAVVEQLTARGHEPVVVDIAAIESPPSEVRHHRADVRDRGQLVRALADAEGVIHTASLIDLHLGRPDRLHEVNVTGARNVVDACRQAGVPRLVHMSSAEAITGATPLRGVSESAAVYPQPHLSYYGTTKQAGEQIVLAAADEDLGTCAMRTYGLYGIGDNTVVPLYLSAVPGRSIVLLGDLSSRTDMIFASNLAHCLVLAVEQLDPGVEWSGTAFHVTDHEPVNVQRFLSGLVAPLGYRVVDRFRLPPAAARALASFYEARWRMTGSDRFARPPLTRHKLRLGLDDYWLDASRVRDVLDYRPPFSRSTSIELTQQWLLSTRG